MPSARFDSGPARAMTTLSRLGCAKFRGSNETGFAQPKPAMTINKKPIGSKVSLPSAFAVPSPSLYAASAWQYSCSVSPMTIPGREYNVSMMSKCIRSIVLHFYGAGNARRIYVRGKHNRVRRCFSIEILFYIDAIKKVFFLYAVFNFYTSIFSSVFQFIILQ